MGWPTTSCAEEKDVTHEKAAPADGRQGIEGRHGVEQMQRVREGEESACAVPILCAK